MTGLARAIDLLETYAEEEGVHFDFAVYGVSRKSFDVYHGDEGLVYLDDGRVAVTKDFQFDGGTVTVQLLEEELSDG